jgi:NmrA-like family protein
VAVEDLGGVVEAIFRDPEAFKDKTVGIVGDDLPCAEYAAIMSRGVGKKVVYSHMPREKYAALGFPGADDLANMFEYNRLYIPNRKADLEQSRRLYAGMQRFEPWIKANQARLLEVMR